MADPRKHPGNHRSQAMGPPETPSRVMQPSPNMFPTLEFSPDFFSTQSMSPMTAPVYPQQRLFWDVPPQSMQISQMDQQNFDSFNSNWDTSFDSTSTMIPGFTPLASQDQSYELPMQPQSSGPYLDPGNYPAPFHTSPRVIPPTHENPAEFLSSPARRFGGNHNVGTVQHRRPVRDVPAYHHQMQESKREMELERERRRNKAAKRADDELLMNSVRRALTPSKPMKPGLQRSVTHSGVTAQHTRNPQQQPRPQFNDSASTSSATSNISNRNGRSSPLKRTSSAAGLTKSSSAQKPRTAVSLSIDEHGVAKTILGDLLESDTDADEDDLPNSVASSGDENDFNAIHSQSNSFSFAEHDDVLTSLQDPATVRRSSKRTYERLGSGSVKRASRPSLASLSSTDSGRKRALDATVRPSKKSLVLDTSNDTGDAQKALRAIIGDRSRSTSTLDDYPSSRHSDSSVQFHSSPPLQQGQYGAFSGSPATITDPELATPSTDQESFALGAMRCVCNSTLPDGSMVQW